MVGGGRNGLFWWGLGVVGVAGFVGVVGGLFVVGDEGAIVAALTAHTSPAVSRYIQSVKLLWPGRCAGGVQRLLPYHGVQHSVRQQRRAFACPYTPRVSLLAF